MTEFSGNFLTFGDAVTVPTGKLRRTSPESRTSKPRVILPRVNVLPGYYSCDAVTLSTGNFSRFSGLRDAVTAFLGNFLENGDGNVTGTKNGKTALRTPQQADEKHFWSKCCDGNVTGQKTCQCSQIGSVGWCNDGL